MSDKKPDHFRDFCFTIIAIVILIGFFKTAQDSATHFFVAASMTITDIATLLIDARSGGAA